MPHRTARPRSVSLHALLRDGHWGALRVGMSRQELVAALGVPARWLRSDAEVAALRRGLPVAGWMLSPILHYGGMEFHFPEDPAGRCWMIFTDDLPALHLRHQNPRPPDERLHISPGWLAEGLEEAAVCAHLSAAGLSCTRAPFPPAPSQLRLCLASGVRLGLASDDDLFEAPGHGPRLFCVEALGRAPL